MARRAALMSTLAALAALALGACGVGAGESEREGATLTITRDLGARVLLRREATEVPGGETVMRFLQRNADVKTGYGGRFVDAIESLRSGRARGEQRDWFYYVNGIEASEGAADRDLAGGDRVWWDYRDWSAAMRVPAVVGSFPEPFLSGAEGKRYPVRIDCAPGADGQCGDVAEALDRVGVDASIAGLGTPVGDELLRVLVGRWDEVRDDNAAGQIEEGPRESGVFARVHRGDDGFQIDVLDRRGRVVETLGPGSGIVAATRFEEQQPTWAVSGTDDAGLARAVRLLTASALRNRFAVAADGSGPRRLPAPEEGSG